ncbi:MAG: Icc protein [Gammaproteobacteria bacterium]
MQLVQISDLHMTPGDAVLHGLNPAARLRECVADINQRAEDAQLCIVTGDLADKGETGAYETVRACLDELTMPYCVLIGNHDHRERFLHVFPEVPTDEHGFVQYSKELGDAVLLCLDTVEAGSHAGSYCDRRCEWLAAELAKYSDRAVYLFMHHPPFSIGLPGLDVIRLLESEGIEAILRNAPQVRHIFFGHVHRPVSGCWHGIPFSALPGTLHQVALNFDAPPFIVYSHERPGYALIEVTDAQTVVHLQDFIDTGPRRLQDNGWVPALPAG